MNLAATAGRRKRLDILVQPAHAIGEAHRRYTVRLLEAEVGQCAGAGQGAVPSRTGSVPSGGDSRGFAEIFRVSVCSSQ
jgi:hypothetical protein